MPYRLREKAFILRHTRGTARKHILNHTFEMHRGDTRRFIHPAINFT
jgi:hypothetical protein